MNNIDISFVVPTRKRDEMKPYMEKNIKENFSGYNYEIIYVEQCDDKPFKVAQLRNIGFMHSSGDFVVIRDVDVLDINNIDIEKIYTDFSGPYRAYDSRQHFKIMQDGSLEKYLLPHKVCGYGGYIVFKRDLLKEKNGFTNLCMGYGYEDNVTQVVYGLKTYEQAFGHIYHQDNSTKNLYNTNINRIIYEMYCRGEINSQFDGYKQMKYDIINQTTNANIKTIFVENIGVVSDFKYMDLYNRHFSV